MTDKIIVSEDDIKAIEEVLNPSNDEEVVEEIIIEEPIEKKNIRVNDIQTKDNTTFFNDTKYVSPIKKDEKPKTLDGEPYFLLTVMKNLTNERIEELSKVISAWELYESYNQRKERIKPEAYAMAQNNFEKLASSIMPDKSLDEVARFCLNTYSYIQEFSDNLLLGEKKLENGLVNLIERFTNKESREIIPLIPSNKILDVSPSQIIRRTRKRATQSYEYYDISLSNSFIKLRIKRPELEDLTIFTQQLDDAMRSVTRTYNGNSLTLARAETYQAVLDLLKKLIIDTTIEDLASYEDLDDLIRYTDMQTILLGLASAAEGDSFPITVGCSNPRCGDVEIVNVDPTYMLNVDKTMFTPEQGAMYNNICNRNTVLKTYQIKELFLDSKPVKSVRVDLEDGRSYLTLREPNMTTYFETYDFFKDKTEPLIEKLRTQPLSQDEYKTRLEEYLALFKMIEFYQWIDEYYVWNEDNQEGISYTRSSIGDSEFNIAIYEELSENPALTSKIINLVGTKCKLMSSSVVGINEYKCAKCGEYNLTDGDKEKIIPIDMLMGFIYLVQAKFSKIQRVIM